MVAWGDLLGEGSIAQQFLIWNVASQLVNVLLTPTEQLVQQELWQQQPYTALSPAQVADMVLKNIMSQADGETEAALSGINASRFDRMVLDTGEPPGVQDMLLMYRRGIIPEGPDTPGTASLEAGIRSSRLRDEWTDAIIASRVVPISTAAAVDAVIRNQIALSAGETIGYENGIANADFDLLVQTAGNPPALGELLELLRRGIIEEGDIDPATVTPDPTALTFSQGVLEGDSKDKWLGVYAQLQVYLPPPRTVVTLLKAGAISPAEAATLLQDSGLSATLAAAYVAEATTSKTSAAKNLNESTILELYTLQLLPQADAEADLVALGYTPAEANLLLTTATSKQELAALNRNVAKIGTYYVAHKIDQATASTQLANLGVPAAQVTTLLAGWTIDRQVNVKLLTPAQVVDAWEYAILTQAQAEAALEADGYDPYDAWVLLSIKNKAPLPNPPAPGPAPIQ